MTAANSRVSPYDIDPLFLERWSPRAFADDEISQAELETILEAARWAPSSYNSQPWRMVYARRNTTHWNRLLDLLIPFNRSWAEKAAALVVMASNSLMLPPGAEKPVPSHSHSFDTGAAWAQLALQATRSGWHAHGMVGFDMQRAFAELNVPEGYRVEAAIAIGRLGDKMLLPDAIRARETPSDRRPLADVAFEGGFPSA